MVIKKTVNAVNETNSPFLPLSITKNTAQEHIVVIEIQTAIHHWTVYQSLNLKNGQILSSRLKVL